MRASWVAKARKLSPKLRDIVATGLIHDEHARKLLKYSHSTQNRLADVIIRKKITKSLITKKERMGMCLGSF